MDFELENGGGGGSVFVLKKTSKNSIFHSLPVKFGTL